MNSTTPPSDAGDSIWPSTERRKDEITRAIHDIQRQLKDGNDRMGAQDKAIAENTKATLEVKANTAEIVEFFKSMQGAFKVFNFFGTLAKPIGYIAVAGTALWSFYSTLKTGHMPPK